MDLIDALSIPSSSEDRISELESCPSPVASALKTYFTPEKLKLPRGLEEVDLSKVLTVDVWTDQVSEQDKSELLKLLPEEKINQTLEEIFTGQTFHFQNPISEFKASSYPKDKELQKSLWLDRLYTYTSSLNTEIPERLKNLDLSWEQSEWNRRKLIYYSSDSESSEDSMVSVNFDGCSSGHSTIMDNEENGTDSKRRPEENEKEAELKREGNLDWIKHSTRFKDVHLHKNQVTIKPTSAAGLDMYRRQEAERYKSPLSPWAYQLFGNTYIVAPVCKKLFAGRAKDTPWLVSDRPNCVTILSIVRDAAARLPDGVGTRADISQLVKDSQFISENIKEVRLTNLVTGALRDLQYDRDPCVVYESNYKLWVYVHRSRGLDYQLWKPEVPAKRGRPAMPYEGASKEFAISYLDQSQGKKRSKNS